MKKRILYICLVTVLGLNLLLGAQIYISNVQAAETENVYEEIRLLMRVMERVRQDYVDGEKVTYSELIQAAMRGMLSTLDPHSEFMDARKYTDLRNDTEGAFGGVGIVVGLREGSLTVVAPMEDSPAYEAGILAGDRIVKIEGRSTDKITLPEAVAKLRGQPGSSVSIHVQKRAGGQAGEIKEHKLTRSIIKVDTVKDLNGRREFPLNEDKVGYVRITQFGEHTTDELRKALKEMDAAGMQGLVMDLRSNPGGLLDQAVKVCDLFLPDDQLIVSTEGRHGRPRGEEYKATGKDEYPGLKIAILVNKWSASASEIVAGCLQDVQRAYIIGETTFGKGSVQSIMPLNDGTALRLTTAKYYTPSHKVIHEKGIKPDSDVSMTLEEEEALYLKRVVGGVESLDEDQRAKVEAVRDVQLDRAMDYLKGQLIYPERASRLKASDTKVAAQRD